MICFVRLLFKDFTKLEQLMLHVASLRKHSLERLDAEARKLLFHGASDNVALIPPIAFAALTDIEEGSLVAVVSSSGK